MVTGSARLCPRRDEEDLIDGRALRDSAREPLSLIALAARDDLTAGPRVLLSTARAVLADDPFTGLALGKDHRWRLTDAPGLGVERRG